MAEYNNPEEAVAGLLDGSCIDNVIEGRWCCKETDGILPGKAVFGYSGDNIGLYLFYNDTAKVAYDAEFVTDNLIDVTVNGVAITQVPWNATHVATMADVIAAVDGLDGVKAILDATDGTGKTFLVQTKGATAVVSTVVTGGAGQAVATITYASSQVFVGVSVFNQRASFDSEITRGQYDATDAVNVLAQGRLHVGVATDVKANNEAYIDNAGADIGEFSSAGIELNTRYRTNGSASGLCVIQVVGQTEMTYADIF